MLILTPNRRLSAFSQRKFQEQQIAAGKTSWQTPDILPIEVWLLHLWQLCLESKVVAFRPLLSKMQQQRLLEQIIQKSVVTIDLLRLSATAQNVLQAWGFLQQWQVGLDKLAAYAQFSSETAALYTWLTDYIKWLDQNNYYDLQLMVDHLIHSLPQIICHIPKKICIRGFGELVPQYAKLIRALTDLGVEIIPDQLLAVGAKLGRVSAIDTDAELHQAAYWAQQELAKNPQQLLGIVVPELERLRAQVINIFTAYVPMDCLNVSAPCALSNYPVIDNALLILQLAKPQINFVDFSVLLRSTFIIDASGEASQRAQIDRALREQVSAQISWDELINKLVAFDTTFTQMAQNFVTLQGGLNGLHTAEYWVTQFQKLLAAWGWPGDRPLTVDEIDLLGCWREVLVEYSKLQSVLQEHNVLQAVHTLHKLINEIPFLPAETGVSKIHVLGVLEADGIFFDRLWVCGMTRDAWPPAASPNPYIPIELQRQYALPRSSPQRELAVAKRLTANLQQGGKYQVIFSYPQIVDDANAAPSNLIMHFPETPTDGCLERPQSAGPVGVLETYVDDIAPPMVDTHIAGGTNSLKLQAQCPFKANAELRWRAKPLAEPDTILTPVERGSIVHAVLEDFWRECKTQTQLLACAQLLSQKLPVYISKVLQRWQQRKPKLLTTSYMALEADRLQRLLYKWLQYETTRADFTVISLEHKTPVKIGELQINLQADRIDELADGSYAVIDYKTGNVRTLGWFGDTILEPQLPLYAVYLSEKISTLAIAHLHSHKVKFIGYAAEENLVPDVKSVQNWSAQIKQWQHSLIQTAAALIAGDARVLPYGPEICQRCKLQALCRVYDGS